MSHSYNTSPYARSMSVERQFLALGAAREKRRQAIISAKERERSLELALLEWQNEGGFSGQ